MIDTTRHNALFDAVRWGREGGDITIVGCGATGSRVALELGKLGVTRMQLWDDDRVEEHNIANQAFTAQHLGMYKVDAVRGMLQMLDAEALQVAPVVQKMQQAGAEQTIMFLLTDTVSSRRQIGESLHRNSYCQLLIETRMGVNMGNVYAFDPRVPSHYAEWVKSLPASDEETVVEASACGTALTLGASAAMTASMAVWQFITWVAGQWGGKQHSEVVNELMWCAQPWMVQTRRWL